MADPKHDDEVVLLDENGSEGRFSHVLTFLYEGERYVALEPEDADGESDAEAEIVLLRVVSENGEDTYVSIDNEALLDEVFDEFLSLMDEIDEDDES
ncbi:MAG: DUF1292 domain-containing protein [Eubacteriales bacterium]|nr:DUF1292 domain-containing protein [Eubacteriales bacterium]